MNVDTITTVAVIAIAVIALVILVAKMGTRPKAIPVRARPILTRAELSFYRHLVRALERIGGVDVFPQVSMSAIIETTPGLDARERMAVRSTFNRKYVDFVIIDGSTRPLLIVELDDRTHEEDKDRRRDAIMAAAGIATLRISGSAARDDREIERRLRQMLPS